MSDLAPTVVEAWPLRVRLHGGRNTHAARITKAGDRVTPCGYVIAKDGTNHWLADDAGMTCRNCVHRIQNPRIGDPRQHTPDVESINAEGRRVTTFRLKRCCNGCGARLGDADNRDVTRDGELTDVRSECVFCAGRLLLEA